MFPAKTGDCILIHFVDLNYRILVDGGFASTYSEYLKPYLKHLSSRGEKIDLIVVTHIDHDHIGGIKKLILENGRADSPKIINIDEIWFNGFKHMPNIEISSEKVPFFEKGILQNMASNNYTEKHCENGLRDISFTDGNSLAELLCKNGYAWNKSFGGKAVNRELVSKICLGDIEIEILNPSEKELIDLARNWIRELSTKCKHVVISDNCLFYSAFEGCYMYEKELESSVQAVSNNQNEYIDWELESEQSDMANDVSINNLSSIALLIHYNGVTLLFPGDCPINHIISRVPLKVDIVKLPHHGSGKSSNKDFISSRKVKFYLLSTDGTQYGHPSKTIMGSIICKAEGTPVIIKNYDIPMLSKIGIVEKVNVVE